jgi:AcrR family transcriptional regulator
MSVATRDRILNVAFDLFYRHGFYGVGINEIARQAGTTRQTLYNHFESKDEIVLEVIERRDQAWRKTFSEEIVRRGGEEPIAQLRSALDVVREFFRQEGFNGCLLICAATAFPLLTDPAHRAAKANVDAIRGIIQDVAARAGFENPESFARQFNLILEGAIVTEAFDRDNTAADTAGCLIDTLIDRHSASVAEVPGAHPGRL